MTFQTRYANMNKSYYVTMNNVTVIARHMNAKQANELRIALSENGIAALGSFMAANPTVAAKN